MLSVLARSLQHYFLMASDNTVQPANFIGNKVTGIVSHSSPLILVPTPLRQLHGAKILARNNAGFLSITHTSLFP